MIGTDEIRRLLTRHQIVPADYEELDDDTPITLDSLALVWLQHVLDEEHGISIDPYGADLDFFTSARGIGTYLANHATDAKDGIHAH
ncbi:acyl carrier protein [Peterkaempfera bronchialis]|uniref:Acyl carrier protein n=1 Tax=Peterkaempfera bronchialis TaxID=2126346 RepID=A0A345SU65_9ACTN|nr:acyl carrier protein [Peterkaempfera bronchialis]AXI77270.1 acyl carrier protein [Peterkaempfera bronchialis]